MTSKPWSRVAPIVDAALMYDDEARAAFVAEACGNDLDLLHEVESLLAHASGDADFLSTPALAMAPSVWSDRQLTMLPATGGLGDEAPTDASRLAPGQRVGVYRIERLLGRGGMGEVYEAEHIEHGRRIALKVLSPGLSEAIDRAQFLREGQLAAAVNHPHLVYIYGSEDIAGMPAIAMELLRGGTLKERVEKEGPLAPIEAVDAMLQVVSGLDAAHDAGVLHRDIKPSNCFVDADGTIKVGDFGLAIPALEHTQLTAMGTIQATPQFASPEQLRGKPLDVRSDIYAVGATLYYLLAGRPPFDDRDVMALVSRIATDSPTSPREARREIPRALAAVVLQCLAKSPAHRPASYRVLAKLLEPFGSTVKTPAPLGIRTAAYAFDNFFSILLPMNILLGTFVVLGRPSSAFSAQPVMFNLVAVSYFAITEGVWGASPGKALCGCRVVTESGGPPPFARTLLRALILILPPWFASGVVVSIAGLAYSMQGSSAIIATVVVTIGQALFFVTARRANGFAGIHEWATRTRTVLKSAVGVHGRVKSTPNANEVPAGRRWVGPYRIVETSSSQPDCGAALGYDDRLRRTVWLRSPGVDADPVPHGRRILRRPTRPRWLAGQRASGLAWDAYEQVPGQSFDTVVTRAQSWETVRGWLCDLAGDVQAALRDGSLPALAFDRVWIGNDGRAWLLDWPAPSLLADRAISAPPKQPFDLQEAQRFLARVAVSALEGHVLADTRYVRTPRVPLPIPATDCLAKLGKQRFATSEDMLSAVMSAARGPAAISRMKRTVHLSLCAIPTLLMLVIGLLSVYNLRPRVVSSHPHVRSVNAGEAAERAGVEAGDVLIAVDGEPITFASQLADAAARHPEQLDHAVNPPRWSPGDDSRDTDAKGQPGAARNHNRERHSRAERWSNLAVFVAPSAGWPDGRREPRSSIRACRSRRLRARPDECCHHDEDGNTCVRIEDTVASGFELVARAGSGRGSLRRSVAAADAHLAGRPILGRQSHKRARLLPERAIVRLAQTRDRDSCAGRVRARRDFCASRTGTWPPGSPGRHMAGAALAVKQAFSRARIEVV